MRSVYDWLRGNRLLAVLTALVLVALPTLFALFPVLTVKIDRHYRELMLSGWCVVAAFTALAAQTSDSEKEKRSEGVYAAALASNRMMLRQYMIVLLDPKNSNIPDTYRVSVYLWDKDKMLLLPWFPTKTTEPSDAAVFRSGQGATGTAYRDNKPVVAVEGAVSSGEFGLTAAQQKAFARDVVVAAVPVRLINSPQVVGVLTVISDQNLDETFATRSEVVKDDGIRLLEDLADKIGDGLSMEPLPS